MIDNQNDLGVAMQRKRAGLLILGGLLVIMALLSAWLVSGRELVPGVSTRALGPCDVDWHAKRGTLVLACPRQDVTRLWPLPMIHLWFEDGDPRYGTA